MSLIKSSNSNIERWDFIDLLEFLGIFFVLVYHTTTYSFSFLEHSRVIYYIRYFLRAILPTSIPLFFFANGYLLFNRELNLKKHIFKTINILVLTVLWGIIYILLLMPIEQEYLSLREIFIYLWTWHTEWISFLWYMGAMVCLYLLFPILKTVFDTKKDIFLYFTIMCAILTLGNKLLEICGTLGANTFLGLDIDLTGVNLFNNFNLFRELHGYSFVYFCMGGLAPDFMEKIKSVSIHKRNIIALIVIFISCIGSFATGVAMSKDLEEMYDIVWQGFDTIFTLANTCAIFVLSISYCASNHTAVNRFICTVSCNTLGIYFIHEILIHLTSPVVQNWYVAQNYLGTIVYASFILIASLLIVLLIRKIPFLKYLVELKKI